MYLAIAPRRVVSGGCRLARPGVETRKAPRTGEALSLEVG